MNNYYFTEENTRDFSLDELKKMNKRLSDECIKLNINISNVQHDENDIVKHIIDTISDGNYFNGGEFTKIIERENLELFSCQCGKNEFRMYLNSNSYKKGGSYILVFYCKNCDHVKEIELKNIHTNQLLEDMILY